MRRGGLPLAIAALGLGGALLALLVLYGSASSALRTVLDERLGGAGATGALLFRDRQPDEATLLALMRANALDGAYVVGRGTRVLADAAGGGEAPLDLLRVNAEALQAARAGHTAFVDGVEVGLLKIRTGYFPLSGSDDGVRPVLVLEAGQTFFVAERSVRTALLAGAALAVLGAIALGWVALRWVRGERERGQALARAARGETLAQLAAMAAHEIRNPLGVIRGTVELMRERTRGALTPRDDEALSDVLSEVERLRRLTDDLLELGSSRALQSETLDLAELLQQVARGAEAAHTGLAVSVETEAPLRLQGDEGRLRQVFANLLRNAAETGPNARVRIRAHARGGLARVEVSDNGPGIPEEVRASLFTPFASGKSSGTGLGLALSRRLVERHQGTLELLPSPAGATFEILLPFEVNHGARAGRR